MVEEFNKVAKALRSWLQAICKDPIRTGVYTVLLIVLIIIVSFFVEIGSNLTRLFGDDCFHVTLSSLIRNGYPGSLVTTVALPENKKTITPIGLALHVEVVNLRPTMTRIQAHVLDVYIDGSWKRLQTFSPLANNLYLAPGGDLSRATRMNFSNLDVLAATATLETGKSLSGWVFYQWPVGLRQPSPGPTFERMRMTIWNSHGESQSIIMKRLEEEGLSTFGRGGTVLKGEQRDLSGFAFLPQM